MATRALQPTLLSRQACKPTTPQTQGVFDDQKTAEETSIAIVYALAASDISGNCMQANFEPFYFPGCALVSRALPLEILQSLDKTRLTHCTGTIEAASS